jgi:hypothetical protein
MWMLYSPRTYNHTVGAISGTPYVSVKQVRVCSVRLRHARGTTALCVNHRYLTEVWMQSCCLVQLHSSGAAAGIPMVDATRCPQSLASSS